VDSAAARGDGSAVAVLLASFWQGCSAFGGPIAHLGYFEHNYVERRRWIGSEEYAGIVALCQLLPGPTSSQVGFLIGWHRAGWRGGIAAWIGFTLPAAILMFAFAILEASWQGPIERAVLHGLKLVAVAFVAQAVLNMSRTLCPDLRRAMIAIVVALCLLMMPTSAMQLLALAASALAGLILCRSARLAPLQRSVTIDATTAAAACAAFVALLLLLPIASARWPHGPLALAEIFYRSGACVFGGGHVVLPLLRDALVPRGWISDAVFLNGYGAAQAVPGPLFSVAAYLGAASAPPGSVAVLWAAIAVVSLFLPGLLLAVAGFWLWRHANKLHGVGPALAGMNAGVVGVLAAAFCNPVWTTSILTPVDALIGLGGLLLLSRARVAPLLVVVTCVCASVLCALWTATAAPAVG
jgi:chromate transporter